jgi:5-methyltetrahydropteroyltriglutamate--homocysteine methyltransferase
VDRLQTRGRLTAEEVQFLRQHAPGPIEITLPSAYTCCDLNWREGVTDRVYRDRLELGMDCARILRDEVRALLADGVQYIQIDAPTYGFYVDEEARDRMRHNGLDPDRALDEAIACDNAVIEGMPREGVTFGFHICRGNSASRWYARGGYGPIAEKVFGQVACDTFLLEYDSDRAGGFAPLRFIPPGKMVVLGLVTTKEPDLEPADDLLRRIDEAAAFLPLERLAVSTQCGFASVAGGNHLTVDDERRKLERVVEVADRVWR